MVYSDNYHMVYSDIISVCTLEKNSSISEYGIQRINEYESHTINLENSKALDNCKCWTVRIFVSLSCLKFILGCK